MTSPAGSTSTASAKPAPLVLSQAHPTRGIVSTIPSARIHGTDRRRIAPPRVAYHTISAIDKTAALRSRPRLSIAQPPSVLPPPQAVPSGTPSASRRQAILVLSRYTTSG